MTCCIVKRKVTFSSVFPLIAIFLITLVLAALSAYVFIYMPIFIFCIGMGIALFFAPGFLKTEYEYNIEGDTFSVSIIKNKSSRKELFACDIEHLLSCTPFESRDKYTKTKLDIKASSPENSLYYAVFSEEDKTVSITFSPSEDFMKSFRLLAPLKVKLI